MTAPLKADQQAAERLLKAAVRRAVEEIASWPDVEPLPEDREDVVYLLEAAGFSADLLLAERAS